MDPSAIVRAVKRTLAVEFCYCSVDMSPGMNIVRDKETCNLVCDESSVTWIPKCQTGVQGQHV